MATIQTTKFNLPIGGDYNGIRIEQWLALANGDQGSAVELVNFADRTVQVTGTFGAGGSLTVEGSLDGVTYGPLTDPQGNNLVFTSGKLETISEVVRFIRPRVTAGDGTTALNVYLLFRKG
jgi:hypothetical protein